MEVNTAPISVRVHAPVSREIAEILTPDALSFVGFLCSQFEERRQLLLAARKAKATSFDAGDVPQFVSEKQYKEDWKCAPVPNDIRDRRVEITGPVDRKVRSRNNSIILYKSIMLKTKTIAKVLYSYVYFTCVVSIISIFL